MHCTKISFWYALLERTMVYMDRLKTIKADLLKLCHMLCFICIFTGKPYFVSSNNATQYSIVYQNTVVTTDIVTFETLTNAALFAVNMKKSNYSSIKHSPVTVKDTMYDSKVTVHATRVMFLITIKSADEFRQYTVVVNNTKGSSSYDIWLRSASKKLFM